MKLFGKGQLLTTTQAAMELSTMLFISIRKATNIHGITLKLLNHKIILISFSYTPNRHQEKPGA